MTECSRCNNDRNETVLIFTAQPGGHSLGALSTLPSAPQGPERVCGDCITDDEISRMLGPSVAFVLGVMIQRADSPESIPALEMTRARFMVRSNDNDNGRRAAVRALGL